ALGGYFLHFGSTDQYLFATPNVQQVSFRKDTFRITDFGAKSEIGTANTAAIQRAVDSCSEAGGGTVVVPAGLWTSGPIVLKNDVNLHLAEGALLQFSDNFDDYPIVETTWEGQAAIRCQSPLSATGSQNIAITGRGVIDGAGQIWRQ